MKSILVTGATGNIGSAVLRYLGQFNSEDEIIAAVRNVERAKKSLGHLPELTYRPFDIEDTDSHQAAFRGIDILFLLRPPHISDVEAVFRPLLESARENGIQKVVFLSVQGAEKSSVIPHNKIEGLIQSLEFKYIFVRPSYFMQNLTTTLLPEIVNNQRITLPSGKAKFNWIDVENIGEASARLILHFEEYQNKAYEITGTENKSFGEVAALMTSVLGEKIDYKSINPIRFYFKKRKEGVPSGFAVVMTILHFLPRIQGKPDKSDNFRKICGREPVKLREFIERERDTFTTPSPKG